MCPSRVKFAGRFTQSRRAACSTLRMPMRGRGIVAVSLTRRALLRGSRLDHGADVIGEREAGRQLLRGSEVVVGRPEVRAVQGPTVEVAGITDLGIAQVSLGIDQPLGQFVAHDHGVVVVQVLEREVLREYPDDYVGALGQIMIPGVATDVRGGKPLRAHDHDAIARGKVILLEHGIDPALGGGVRVGMALELGSIGENGRRDRSLRDPVLPRVLDHRLDCPLSVLDDSRHVGVRNGQCTPGRLELDLGEVDGSLEERSANLSARDGQRVRLEKFGHRAVRLQLRGIVAKLMKPGQNVDWDSSTKPFRAFFGLHEMRRVLLQIPSVL